MESEIIPTFLEFNYQSVKAPAIVVYENPTNFEGYFVARLFSLADPTAVCMVKEKLEDLLNEIPSSFAKIMPSLLDDSEIKYIFI